MLGSLGEVKNNSLGYRGSMLCGFWDLGFGDLGFAALGV